jgi:hypothetical protein
MADVRRVRHRGTSHGRRLEALGRSIDWEGSCRLRLVAAILHAIASIQRLDDELGAPSTSIVPRGDVKHAAPMIFVILASWLSQGPATLLPQEPRSPGDQETRCAKSNASRHRRWPSKSCRNSAGVHRHGQRLRCRRRREKCPSRRFGDSAIRQRIAVGRAKREVCRPGVPAIPVLSQRRSRRESGGQAAWLASWSRT